MYDQKANSSEPIEADIPARTKESQDVLKLVSDVCSLRDQFTSACYQYTDITSRREEISKKLSSAIKCLAERLNGLSQDPTVPQAAQNSYLSESQLNRGF